MRYRVIVETDFAGSARAFRESLRANLLTGELAKPIPGEIVYVATEPADTSVVSHDGKITTVG